jgi:DHA2 family multidrug resistance protein-like MFS transporter
MTGLSAEADDGDVLVGTRRTSAIACVLAALGLVVLDSSIANVALPAIARSLQVTPAEAVHVVTAYQMALVMALLPCAALGESRGHRPVYTAGLALFVGASVLCALAPSLPLLVAARFLQGLGAAAIMSLSVALLRFSVPQQQLGRAIGWNTLVVALSSAAGPALGALVLSAASWPWLFAVNLPLGALVLFAARALPNVAGTARALDIVSMASSAAAFAGLVAGAELMPERPALGSAALVAAVAIMFVVVRRETPWKAPMIPVDLLREGSFRISVIASVCCFVGQSAATISLPFYLQHGLGRDVLETGLLMTPWPLTVALMAPLAGSLANRISGAWLCALGGVALAVGLASLALRLPDARPWVLVGVVALCGAGFGLFQVSNNRNMFMSTPRARSSAAGGMQGTARLTGQTLGALTMTLVFTMTSMDTAPRIGFGVAAGLTLIAGLVSTLRAPEGWTARSAGALER